MTQPDPSAERAAQPGASAPSAPSTRAPRPTGIAGRLERLQQILRLMTVFALAGLVVEFGFPVSEDVLTSIRIGQIGVVVLFAVQAALGIALAPDRRAHLRKRWLEVALLALILLDVALASFLVRSQFLSSFWFLGVQIYLVARVAIGLGHVQEWLTRRSVRPALLLVGSYTSLSFLGAGLLALPLARAEGAAPWTFTDAFFTATSAVCVTGLSVRDVGSELSVRGQVLLLALIQIGGLGLVTLACGAGLLERGRLGVRELNVASQVLGITAPGRVRRFLAFVLTFTLACEALGAAALWVATHEVDLKGHDRLWWSVFHSVSAFCNAGFGLSPLSLVPWAERPGIVLTVAALIIVGGLGFAVHMDILGSRSVSLDRLRWLRWRLSESGWWPFGRSVFESPLRPRISLNTRLVVVTTACLLVAGTVLFTAMESRHAFSSRSMGGMWLEGFFHSVTARTAGFNTIDVSALQATSFVLFLVLMIIGASPLSTGGGLRTTTVAVAFLAIRAMTRNREQVEAFGRSLPLTVVHACIAIAVMYATALTVVVSALLLTQTDVMLRDAVFESVSALSTVGLSTGLTQDLDTTGRWILCVAMIAGRIGPLAVLWTFVARPAPLRYRYPEEPVVIV